MTVNPTEARLALSRVLQSRVFERAQRSQRFLRYLADSSLADPPIAVKEYTLAIEVFDRNSAYDPSVDATVRVEASRLREYYAEEGRQDPWLIAVPKGSYSLFFTPRDPVEPVRLLVALSNTVVNKPLLEQKAGESGPLSPPAQLAPSSHSAFRIGGLLVLALLAGTAVIWLHGRASARSPLPADPISLAILPIANHTGDASLDYVADGLTDDLIRQLSQVPALRLTGRTTMFRYRDRTGDAQAVVKALRVRTVLVGQLRRGPEHISLDVELSNTSDGSVVLDREYMADASDIRTVHADLQRDVLTRLHVKAQHSTPAAGRMPLRQIPWLIRNS